MTAEPALGPFVLERPIGRGGMGDVWRGRHVAADLPVAIKVVRREGALDRSLRERFHREVRAMARLDHPNIVDVLDHGDVSEAVEGATSGALAAGSPFLVMELAERGSIADGDRPSSWTDVRVTLLAILSALAHTHARGVIHRDIKPSNILVTEEGPKLADFGIAQAVGGGVAASGDVSGTPRYMAPEQFRGAANDLGPWTDLYSVGCVAYELTTGQAPFTAHSVRALAQAHGDASPPPLAPKFSVPAGFADWVEWLLEKDAKGRPRLAADAARALAALGEPAPESMSKDRGRAEDAADTTVTGSLAALTWSGPVVDGERTKRRKGPARAPIAVAVELAVGNADERNRPWHRGLAGAGLGLYAWRALAVVGRQGEKDELWRTLASAIRERQCRLVLLEGPVGSGKTCLADWLAERAMERGCAIPLRATFSAAPGARDGIAAMLTEHLRCTGAGLREARAVAARALECDDALELDALVELMAPALGTAESEDHRPVRFDSPAERFGVVSRALATVASERPVVLVLDAADEGDDALGLAQHLVTSRADAPILVVATMNDATHEAETVRVLEELTTHSRTTRITLGPLSAPEHADLVRRLLHLDQGLAATVEDRTRGSPLFAVELVKDWVRRGVLIAGQHGFELAEGASSMLPTSLQALFSPRLARALFDRPTVRDALQVAALLGNDVDAREWSEVAEDLGIAPRGLDVDWLVRHRLLQETPSGHSFPHAMLRESIEAEMSPAETARVHGAIARVLDRRFASVGFAAERIAKHRLGAGGGREAFPPLITALRFRVSRSEHGAAFRLASTIERILDACGAPDADPERIEARLGRCWLLRRVGRLDEAEALALLCLRGAEVGAQSLGARHALAELGDIAMRRGATEEGLGYLLRAMSDGGPDDSATARAAWTLGWVMLLGGDHGGASTLFERCLAADTDDRLGLTVGVHALWSLGMARLGAGDPEGAREVSLRALREGETTGSRLAVAHAHANLAMISLDEDPARAEAEAHIADAAFENIASPERWRSRTIVAVALSLQKKHAAALPIAEDCVRQLVRAGRDRMALPALCVAWECRAVLGDEAGASDALDTAEQVHRTGRVAMRLSAESLARGSRAAIASGRADLGRRALELAVAQWDAVGVRDAADGARAEIAALGGRAE